nr:MAG TPA: hypothetical protein [Caudoviricetes sp.]
MGLWIDRLVSPLFYNYLVRYIFVLESILYDYPFSR